MEEEEEQEDESNKTLEENDDQYKQAQAKKMFIIQEVDEDAFSERSMSKIERLQMKQESSINQSKTEEREKE